MTAPLYWINGSGNWSDFSNHWATVSGGNPLGVADASAVPTATTPVFFDSLSNASAYTCTIDATTKLCLDLNIGAPLTGGVIIAGSVAITCSGNLTITGTVSFTYTGSITFNSSSVQTITTSGISLAATGLIFNGTGSWQLQDALTLGDTLAITLTKGTLDLNGFNLTARGIINTGTNTRAITTTGTPTILMLHASGTPWQTSGSGFTLTAGSSIIKYTGGSSSTKTFAANGQTHYDLWNATTGTGAFIITGSSTFHDIKIDAGRTHQFTASTTTTVTSLTAVGASTIIQSVTAATHTLSAASGTIAVQNCAIDHSIATGGATWNAYTDQGNVDGGNNTGWIFTDPGSNFLPVFKPILQAVKRASAF